jgi:hypothetical protein
MGERPGAAPAAFTCRQLTASEIGLMHRLLEVFSDAFDHPKSYRRAVPSDDYLKELEA